MSTLPVKAILVFALVMGGAATTDDKSHPPAGDFTLPSGFTSTTVIESLGNNRHIAINSNGDIYVKMERLKDGKGIYVLRDVKKDGNYVVIKSFGNYGGTGIAIKNGYLYAASNQEVFRYKFVNNEIADPDNPEK